MSNDVDLSFGQQIHEEQMKNLLKMAPRKGDPLTPKDPDAGVSVVYVNSDKGAALQVVFPPCVTAHFEGTTLVLTGEGLSGVNKLWEWTNDVSTALGPYTHFSEDE